MLEVLEQLEKELPTMLADASAWQTVCVDYQLPVVKRLWLKYGDYRLNLNHILSCADGEAHFHPHPWPSAMHVISGEYEMAVGFGAGWEPPPIGVRMIASPGFRYEMIHENTWHYVRPIGGDCISFMITGKPWRRAVHQSPKELNALSDLETNHLLEVFRHHLRK